MSEYRHSLITTGRKILSARWLGRRVPLVMNCVLTERCILRCRYCAIWRSASEELGTETWKQLFHQMADAGTERVGLTGGEPMLREDIGALVKSARSVGLTVNLMSSGYAIKDRLDELADLDFLGISLDGPADVHDALRGRGSFAVALEAIEVASGAGISVWTTTVLTRAVCSTLKEFLPILRALGVRSSFQPVMPELAKGRDFTELVPDRELFEYAMRQLEDQATAIADRWCVLSPGLIRYYQRHWQSDPLPLPLRGSGACHPGGQPCWAGRLFGAIDPRGRLRPCLHRTEEEYSVQCRGVEDSAQFSSAWHQLRTPDCSGCWCDSYLESNKIYGMDINSAWHVYRLLRESGNSQNPSRQGR